MKIKSAMIVPVCTGKRNSIHGMHFKYKEEFEAKANFKLEIKCFNKCGSNYYQNALYSNVNTISCTSCRQKFKREVISVCDKCNVKFCEKCFMDKI